MSAERTRLLERELETSVRERLAAFAGSQTVVFGEWTLQSDKEHGNPVVGIAPGRRMVLVHKSGVRALVSVQVFLDEDEVEAAGVLA